MSQFNHFELSNGGPIFPIFVISYQLSPSRQKCTRYAFLPSILCQLLIYRCHAPLLSTQPGKCVQPIRYIIQLAPTTSIAARRQTSTDNILIFAMSTDNAKNNCSMATCQVNSIANRFNISSLS